MNKTTSGMLNQSKMKNFSGKNYRSLGLGSMLAGVVLFGAGMCASDAIRYQTASARASTELPRVKVDYTRNGTYVNGELVSADGRVGAPRCDYDMLSSEAKRALGVNALREQPIILGDYARAVGADAWRGLLQTTIALMEKKDSSEVK